MISETLFALMFIIGLMLYVYAKHPRLYPIHIMFMVLIPIYVLSEWSNLDVWFAVFAVIFPVLMEFFILSDMNKKANI